ncbi:MAG TPA: MATE family efflux transporter [Firmicutes bacterium]|nr:MATE family efflux transporter [Bacillota bacterium]
MEKELTEGVKFLSGEPKRAVLKLSFPMIIGMVAHSLYSLVDGIWVAGLGSNALAAIGLFFPIFMVVVSLASGIGIGGSAGISRKIGAKDKEMADLFAIHTFILGIFIGILFSLGMLPFLKKIFVSMGAKGEVLKLVIGYAKIFLCGTVILVFANIGGGILRGEGDTKRAMYVMVFGSALNIILDPIFIYKLKMGVKGAAFASIISLFLSSLIIGYWLFIKKDTYVDIKFSSFRLNGEVIKEILRVGIPACFSQISMSLAGFFLNMIIIKTGGMDGIAIFTSVWRIIMLALVPLMGIGMSVTSVVGAAYGAKDIVKLKRSYFYGIKLGMIIESIVFFLIIIFSPQISHLFTYSKKTIHISEDLIKAFRILSGFLPAVPLSRLTVSLFQGIGNGEKAFFLAFLRTIILQLFFSYLFGILLNFGISGVWCGILSSHILGSLIALIWGMLTIQRLFKSHLK